MTKIVTTTGAVDMSAGDIMNLRRSLEALQKQVQDLAAKVEKLSARKKPGRKPAATNSQ